MPAGWSTSSATRRWSSAGADGAVVVALAGREPRRVPIVGLDLLDHAEVLGPPELRADMVAWLDAIVAEAGAT